MKVPIMYKSSERYKAGTDIVYDDGSKLQYPPFIYAVTESGDSGGDGGDDEEGEDIMLIERAVNGSLNKSFSDILSAMTAGKSCIILFIYDDCVFHEYVTACYDYGEDYLENAISHRYYIESTTTISGGAAVNRYYADTTNDNLVLESIA